MSSAAHSLAIEPELRWLPRGKWAFLAAAAGFFATVICAWTEGKFLCFFGVFMTLLVGLPAAALIAWNIVLTLIGTGKKARRPIAARINRAAVLVALFVVAEIPGLCTGIILEDIQVDDAERWCESLIPSIEAWHERTGNYPSSLSELGIELDPPKLCRDGSLKYSATADAYVFDFFDGGFLSGYSYWSKQPSWVHYD